jgi:hypothetical protein
MSADEYLKLLQDRGADRRLRPASSTEVLGLEQELRRPLLNSYARFVTVVGCGRVAGDGRWLHLDPSLTGGVYDRLAERQQTLRRHRCSRHCLDGCPREFLPIYEDEDGVVYGLIGYGSRLHGGHRSTVYVLSAATGRPCAFADDLESFLDQLAEHTSESADDNDCALIASSYGRRQPARAAA